MQQPPDLIEQAARQARYQQTVASIRSLIWTMQFAALAALILLTLILWRVW